MLLSVLCVKLRVDQEILRNQNERWMNERLKQKAFQKVFKIFLKIRRRSTILLDSISLKCSAGSEVENLFCMLSSNGHENLCL